MPEKIVILISGKSNSGKGTVAEIIEKACEEVETYNVIRCSLSTYIRELLKKDFYWDGIDTPESRELMAEIYRVGTKFYPYHMARRVWERDIRPNLIQKRRLSRFVEYVQRMPVNEHEWVDVKNIIIVESFREKVNWDYFLQLKEEGLIDKILTLRILSTIHTKVEDTVKGHISEVDLDNFAFDYYIRNDFTLEHLQMDVINFLRHFDILI